MPHTPDSDTNLARYITSITNRNDFLEGRVTELLKSNNRELRRRRASDNMVRKMSRLIEVAIPFIGYAAGTDVELLRRQLEKVVLSKTGEKDDNKES